MITITTDHSVANDSLDHIYPGPTAYDNSQHQPFNDKVLVRWPDLRLLDIGCAGGGLVDALLDDGAFAVGVEGSDYSEKIGRAAWGTIPGNLFTADATKAFQLKDDDKPLTFDVITAWEFFEHIPESGLAAVCENVKKHLTPDGVFIVSITTTELGLSVERINEDGHTYPGGIEYHVTVHPDEWWQDRLHEYGFEVDDELTQYIDPDWVRGPLTGCMNSWCRVLRQIP